MTKDICFLILIILAILLHTISAQSITNPRSPAEWEEVQGVLIRWNEAHYVSDNGHPSYEGYRNSQKGIVEAALNEGISVFILADETNEYSTLDSLIKMGISSPNIHIIPGGIADNIWTRDNGPFSVYENNVGTLCLIGYDNDFAAEQIVNYFNYPFTKIEDDGEYYTDGGNWLTDGHGNLFLDISFKQDRLQFSQYFMDYFGIQTIHELPPYQLHIDYYMKLINEKTLFVSHIPKSNYHPQIDDGSPQTDSLKIEQAIQYIQDNALSCYGSPYEIVRVQNPPTYDNTALNLTYITDEASYINSLIINKTVIVPTFNHLATDSVALNTYKKYMPGYKIVGVPSEFLAGGGGEIHCSTREIYAENPIFISHDWYPDSLNQTSDYAVSAVIKTESGVADAILKWTTNPTAGFQNIVMHNPDGDQFNAAIPGQSYGAHVHYYIEVTSNNGKIMQKPLVAPAWAFNFIVHPDGATTVDSDIADRTQPQDFSLGQNYPNPFNLTTKFQYSLNRSAHVTISVYNIIGQHVIELLDGHVVAGKHQLSWDGHDAFGNVVVSGVYILLMKTDGYVLNRKIVLMK